MQGCQPELLSVYTDGEASGPLGAEIEEHLRGCDACREALADIRTTRRAVGEVVVVAPPRRIRDRAMSAAAACCSRVRPLIDGYLDNELPAPQREALELHFALCSSCRTELAMRRCLQLSLAAAPQAEVPARMRLQALARCAKRGRLWGIPLPQLPAFFAPGRLATASVAASAVLLIALIQPALRHAWTPVEVPVDPQPAITVDKRSVVAKPGPTALAVPPVSMPAASPVVAAAPRATVHRTPRRISVGRVERTRIARASSGGPSMAIARARESALAAEAARGSGQSAVAPADAMQARLEMLRASERWQFLSREDMLTQLPDAGDLHRHPVGGTERPSPGLAPSTASGPTPV